MARVEPKFASPSPTRIAPGDTATSSEESGLWRQFANATTPESYCASWLALQCGLIDDVAAGVVLLAPADESRRYSPVAFWPERQDLSYLTEVAERAVVERRGLIVRRSVPPDGKGPARSRFDIAYPIEAGERLFGVVALDIGARPEAAINEVLRQLQWGSAWLEVLFHRAPAKQISNERLQAVVETLAALAPHKEYQGAAFALVNALAKRFHCDRVSLGFIKNRHARLEALSHSAQVNKDVNLARAIGAAMDEAIDQRATVEIPTASQNIIRCHEELARQHGNGAICTLPLECGGKVVGALTLEREVARPFASEEVETLQALTPMVGAQLDARRREDRWLWRKILDSGKEQLQNLIGAEHWALKLTVLGLVLLTLFFTFFKVDYRVTAKTVTEPITRRAASAAFNGFIAEAPVRAGDLVKKGQLLVRLDDKDLKLELNKWESQAEQSKKQYYEALGSRNAAQTQVLAAQVDEAAAQVALIKEQLERAQVSAPFDGIVVQGDLSQQLGSPVERGQVLYEIAPLEDYRIVLQVDERDIADVAIGQQGHILLSGRPQDPLPVKLEKITPVTSAHEGRIYYRTEARLLKPEQKLRPGMEGIGKIEIDRRRLIWIWTHDVIDWFRLKLWEWMP